ncbi:nucleotidyltransferase [Paenibacillus sp. D9]|uniref:nucleotidyltransferase n=1 Tax=Paenibacillus sp. D9 TaxID=665792 RepID=UPI00061EE552|nr:nucleotidyltransferase [Paenibacillus sp. D9]KKC46808.1 nucleotidyltransferase [Paenibacillus sp. D9]
MRTAGLIVEYNPFHNGHAYHLQKSVEAAGADAVVAVMSGHFLQRGEPALMDKWARARTALLGGCDLVLELPLAYSVQPAEWFAHGAVAVLESTGVVDAFCFGSESGRLEPLSRAAGLLADEPDEFRALLRHRLGEGAPYPSAYSFALMEYMARSGDAADLGLSPEELALPNQTLGLHYLIALRRLKGRMEPLTIRREGAGYHDPVAESGSIASATALRKKLSEGSSLSSLAPFVPPGTIEVLEQQWQEGNAPRSWDDYFPQLLHRILTDAPASLAGILGMGEGLEHRLLSSLRELPAAGMEALLQAMKTKRYTRTRLQRALLGVLLDLRKDELSPERLNGGPGYIRVLGFTPKGRELLARMRRSASAPVLLSAARAPQGLSMLELDVRATAVYASAGRGGMAPPGPKELFRDYYEPPVRLE